MNHQSRRNDEDNGGEVIFKKKMAENFSQEWNA